MKYEFMPNLGSYQFFLVLIIFLVLPTQAAGGGWFDCYQNRDVSDFELLDEHCKAQGGELIVNPYPNSSTQYRCRCDTSRRQELSAQDMACQVCHESVGRQCEQCHQCGNGGSSYYATYRNELAPLINSCRSRLREEETRPSRGRPPTDNGDAGGGDGGGTGGGDGDPVLSPQEEAQLKQARDACEKAHKEAAEACNQPFKKMFGVDLGPDDMQMIMTVLNVGGQTAMASRAGNPDSMAKACGIMRDVGYVTTALNAGFAAQCEIQRRSCLTQCQHLESTMNHSRQRVAECKGYSGQVAGMATQALMALTSSAGANMCRDLAKVESAGLPPPDLGGRANMPNCADPANASNPICLECRSPESRNNPMCRDANAGNPGGGEGRSNQSSRTPPGGDSKDYDAAGLGVEDGDQKAQIPETPTGEASARRPSGSGTGLGGGGGPQGYDGAPGGHGDSGINTDILHGVGGGGGYTTSGVPVGGGGGGGGFGLPPRPEAQDGDKFDLRKFLPGRQGVKGLQKVTGGEGRRHPELAPSHDNIWRRVSNKYQQLCQRGELYGCQ